MKKLFLFTFLLLSLGIGCAQKEPPKPKTAEEIDAEQFVNLPNYLMVDAQTAGQTVKIREVKFETPGFLAVHEIKDDGAVGTILGFSKIIPQGYNQNVKIALTKKLTAEKKYSVMMHTDFDGDTRFNEKKDIPLHNPLTNELIMKALQVASQNQ